MLDYLRFFGTNNRQKKDRFLIYERDLLLNESLVDHYYKSRNTEWLKLNPLMIVPFNYYGSSRYEYQSLVIRKIFFHTLTLYFYYSLQSYVSLGNEKSFFGSTSKINNFETYDTFHYLMITSLFNPENENNIECVPLGIHNHEIIQEMDVNIELDLDVKICENNLDLIYKSLGLFEKKYVEYCFLKNKGNLFKFYSRLYDSLKLFKMSFSRRNRESYNLINLAVSYELLFSGFYSSGVTVKILSRAKKIIEKLGLDDDFSLYLDQLLKYRGELIHNGKIDSTLIKMEKSIDVKLRYFYILSFCYIVDFDVKFIKKDVDIMAKLFDS